MKIKSLLYFSLALFGVFFLSSSPVANASELDNLDAKYFAKQVQYYDQDNNEIFPYTLEELEAIFTEDNNQPLTARSGYQIYNTNAFQFSNYIWIRSGATFYNLANTTITPNGTARPFLIQVYNSQGVFVGEVRLPGGWVGPTHVPWTHLKRGGSYKIRLANAAGPTSPLKFTNASVWYN